MIFAKKIANPKILKTPLAFLLLVIFLGLLPHSLLAKEKADLAGVKMSFDEPNPKLWEITQKEFFPEKNAGIILYTHVPVYNKKKQAIRPTIGIVYEKFPEPPEDTIVYSINMRMRMPFEPKEVLTHEDGSLIEKYAVGYTAEMDQQKIKHSLIIVHMLRGKVGVQIICDSTSDVMNQVEPDMRKFIKSVTLDEK